MRPMQRPPRRNHKMRLEFIPPVRLDGPLATLIVPTEFFHFGLEVRVVPEGPFVGDPLGVVEHVLGAGVLFGRHVAGFFEEGEVDVGFGWDGREMGVGGRGLEQGWLGPESRLPQ